MVTRLVMKGSPVSNWYVPFHLYLWVKSLTTSAQELTLTIIVRNIAVCPAPPQWRHNTLTLMTWHSKHSEFQKTTGKYWLIFLHHGINRKLCCYALRSTRHPSDSERPPMSDGNNTVLSVFQSNHRCNTYQVMPIVFISSRLSDAHILQ